MKFKCKNCGERILLPDRYSNGKGLTKSTFKNIEINCNHCDSTHTLSMKFSQGQKNNILAYIIDFEYLMKPFKVKNAFWFEETNNSFTLNGYITDCYLLLGFDEEKQLKNKINSIKNTTDKSLLNNCLNIVKITRNKITQHNKHKETLASLTNEEIYPLFINAINIIVMLFKKHGYNPFDIEDRRIETRKVTFS